MEEIHSSTDGVKRKLENDEEQESCELTVKCVKSENTSLETTDTTNIANQPLNESSSSESNSNKQEMIDPLGYTKAEEFTSEIFKIQIHNLPRFGFSELKKRLISLGLKPHKFKSHRPEVTYVCFRNDADRQEAIQKVNGHVWKGRTLNAREAAPAADPFLHRRWKQKIQNVDSASESVVSVGVEPLTFEEAQKRLKDSVVPLWNVEYSKQLESKTEKIRLVLKKMTHQQFVREQFRKSESWNQDGMPCPLLPIIPSPQMNEYRNKNEFTVGYSNDGKTIKVGFRYGLYKDGTTSVGDCTNLGVVKPSALPVIQSFEKFVCESRWPPYLQQTGTGHWHTLTVRSFDSGDIMAMVDFHPRKMEKTEIDEARNSVKEFFTTGEGKDAGIKSLYFRLYAKGPEGVPKLQHIYGEPYVYESLLDLKFRISPEAFFQVNTKATEKLYRLIDEWCEASENSTVMDICCGTGTIGLSMAAKVKQVIGIEMCKSAVDDAKTNSSINNITNATYYCSKVEDIIDKTLSSVDPPSSVEGIQRKDLIAVVDPPRAGLCKSVIKTLRKSEDIERLVYVSCNPESAMENFVDLIRPCSGKLKGQPFSLVKAIPVDLFPGTRHCELVLLFTRKLL